MAKRQKHYYCPSATSLQELIDYYYNGDKNHAPLVNNMRSELGKTTIEDALWIKFNTCLYPHQRRPGYKYCNGLTQGLKAIYNPQVLANAKTFDEFYDYISGLCTKPYANGNILVKTASSVIIFDIAKRLWKSNNFGPNVYLNGNGPRTTVVNILGFSKYKNILKIDRAILEAKYPKFKRFTNTADLEDFLCVMRNDLELLKNKKMIPKKKS